MKTQRLRAIIVDDEQPSREALFNYITEFCPEVEVVEQCKSVSLAYLAINQLNPDLVFLDIEMPGGNGFDLLAMFPTINFKVIFITAFSNYATRAFRVAAADYLLKPIKINELKEAIAKVKKELETSGSFKNLQTLLENIDKKSEPDKNLVISNSKGFDVIKISDIILCQADGYCTNFFIKGKIKITSARNLKFYEELLPKSFFMRIHHSYIINIEHVTGYSNQEVILLAEDNICSLSNAHKTEFLKIFKNGNRI